MSLGQRVVGEARFNWYLRNTNIYPLSRKYYQKLQYAQIYYSLVYFETKGLTVSLNIYTLRAYEIEYLTIYSVNENG
jgi:hypothetical protein